MTDALDALASRQPRCRERLSRGGWPPRARRGLEGLEVAERLSRPAAHTRRVPVDFRNDSRSRGRNSPAGMVLNVQRRLPVRDSKRGVAGDAPCRGAGAGDQRATTTTTSGRDGRRLEPIWRGPRRRVEAVVSRRCLVPQSGRADGWRRAHEMIAGVMRAAGLSVTAASKRRARVLLRGAVRRVRLVEHTSRGSRRCGVDATKSRGSGGEVEHAATSAAVMPSVVGVGPKLSGFHADDPSYLAVRIDLSRAASTCVSLLAAVGAIRPV